MTLTVEETVELLAKARHFCAGIPMHEERGGDRVKGDSRRLVVPHILGLCEMIPGEIRFASALPAQAPERKRMIVESEWRLEQMLGKLRELLLQAQALGLAQEVGQMLAKQTARSKKGAQGRAAKLKEQGQKTRAAVLAEQAKLRAQGEPERQLNKRIAKALDLSVATVRDYRK